MAKIVSIIAGIIAITLGVIFISAWNEAFVIGLQLLLIFILLFGGLIAIIAGISEIKDSITAKKEEKEQKES